MALGAITRIFGNPFTANITMVQRGRLLALQQGGMKVLGGSGSEGGVLSTVDSLVQWSSLALLIPGVALTPIGAAIFAANVVSAAVHGLGYAKNFLGSLFSLDFMGMLTNGLAFAACAITALPCGKLFSRGFKEAFNVIRGVASKMPGGLTTSNCIYSGARYLYGNQFANNLGRCGEYFRGIQTKVANHLAAA